MEGTPTSPLLFSPEQHAEAMALVNDFTTRYLTLDKISARPVFPNLDRDALRILKSEQGWLKETLPRPSFFFKEMFF